MANDRVEKQLDKLKALRALPAAEAAGELKKALRDKVNLIVAKAAQIAGEKQLTELLPDLQSAFERLFEKDKDPQCWGKNALAKALKDLGLQEAALFLRGARHVQNEPVWGGQQDSASVLRGACTLALVQCNDVTRDDVFRCIIDALSDDAPNTRLDAAVALEQMNGRDALLLMRLKARVGDKDTRVTGQILESLLRLEGASAVPWVGEFLGMGLNEVNEEAALALGASRLPEAAALLRESFEKWRRPGGGGGASALALRALSVSRLDEALAFLLELIVKGRGREAEDALLALELQKHSPDIVERVAAAVKERNEPELQEKFRRAFGM